VTALAEMGKIERAAKAGHAVRLGGRLPQELGDLPARDYISAGGVSPMNRAPRDLADRMASRRRQAKTDDGYARETFTQPRGASSADGEGVP
jgi:hypothetical protein